MVATSLIRSTRRSKRCMSSSLAFCRGNDLKTLTDLLAQVRGDVEP